MHVLTQCTRQVQHPDLTFRRVFKDYEGVSKDYEDFLHLILISFAN